jgi:hypothetical protein
LTDSSDPDTTKSDYVREAENRCAFRLDHWGRRLCNRPWSQGFFTNRYSVRGTGSYFGQIGRSVDIGGRMLNIYCSGAGQPAVIFERGASWTFYNNPKGMFDNGAPRPGYGWVRIQRELAKATMAC